MPAKWTGELVGEIHNAGLTIKEVAEAAGMNPKYISTVPTGIPMAACLPHSSEIKTSSLGFRPSFTRGIPPPPFVI
jgi:hypothetical protein